MATHLITKILHVALIIQNGSSKTALRDISAKAEELNQAFSCTLKVPTVKSRQKRVHNRKNAIQECGHTNAFI